MMINVGDLLDLVVGAVFYRDFGSTKGFCDVSSLGAVRSL